MTNELLGIVAGLLAALAWAGNGLLVRGHGPGMHAIAINALRCTLSAVVFVVLWPLVANRAPVPFEAWLFLIVSLVAGLGIGDSVYFEAIKRIGVARAMPISMAYPIVAALGAVMLLGESLGALGLLGIGLTLAGVFLVARPDRADGTRPRSDSAGGSYWSGVLLAAGAAIGWSCSTLMLRPALELVDVPTASTIRMPLAAALLWAAAYRGGVVPPREVYRGRRLAVILASGAVSVASTLLFLQSVALAGAGRAAVLTATSPLFGVPLSIVFQGERGSSRLGLGTLCAVLGVALLALG